jgi:hypothetical protein
LLVEHSFADKLTDMMVEPIGITSGLLTLATFAFQSSITLFRTIQSFQSHLTRVRGVLEELEALAGVLRSLTETISSTTDWDSRLSNSLFDGVEMLVKSLSWNFSNARHALVAVGPVSETGQSSDTWATISMVSGNCWQGTSLPLSLLSRTQICKSYYPTI